MDYGEACAGQGECMVASEATLSHSKGGVEMRWFEDEGLGGDADASATEDGDALIFTPCNDFLTVPSPR